MSLTIDLPTINTYLFVLLKLDRKVHIKIEKIDKYTMVEENVKVCKYMYVYYLFFYM